MLNNKSKWHVARSVARKIKGFGKLDRRLQAAILRHARRAHFTNRAEYSAVMGRTF